MQSYQDTHLQLHYQHSFPKIYRIYQDELMCMLFALNQINDLGFFLPKATLEVSQSRTSPVSKRHKPQRNLLTMFCNPQPRSFPTPLLPKIIL